MAIPATRQQLIDFCLRSLGHPVIEINLASSQIEDRTDDALQFFAQYHFDGTERVYLKHQITQQNIDDGYIPIVDPIMSVLRVFPVSGALGSTSNMFDIRYQMALSDLYYFGSMDLITYDITRSYLRTIQMLLSPEKAIRFSRVQEKLYIDTNWADNLPKDSWIIIEAYRILDPEDCPKIYNDMYLKKYLAALLKRQWGSNLSKFTGISLPGNVQLDGQRILSEANDEVTKLEEQIRSTSELPFDFYMG